MRGGGVLHQEALGTSACVREWARFRTRPDCRCEGGCVHSIRRPSGQVHVCASGRGAARGRIAGARSSCVTAHARERRRHGSAAAVWGALLWRQRAPRWRTSSCSAWFVGLCGVCGPTVGARFRARGNITEGPRGVCVMRLVCGTQRVHGCVWSYSRRTVPARGQVARVWRVSPHTRGPGCSSVHGSSAAMLPGVWFCLCWCVCGPVVGARFFRPWPYGSVRWRAIPTRAPR